MTPFGNWRPNWLLLGGIALALLCWLLLWFLFTEGGRQRHRAAQEELNARVATGQAKAGADAARAVDENAAGDAAIDARVRTDADAINRAPDAGVSVPGVAGAVRGGLCNSPSYRNRPECVQRASPAGR